PADGRAGRPDRILVFLRLEEIRHVRVERRALPEAPVGAVEAVAGVGDAHAAVVLVGAALGGHVDDAAGGAAELRLEAAALDLDLLNELERDRVGVAEGPAAKVAHLGPVDVERVLRAAGAAHLHTAHAGVAVLGLEEHARSHGQERVEAASGLGQALD